MEIKRQFGSMARGWAQESARDGSDSTGDGRETEEGGGGWGGKGLE